MNWGCMRIQVRCPNPECGGLSEGGKAAYIKKGYYKPKHSKHKIPRYQCKVCLKSFSARTGHPLEGSRRPDLDEKVFELFCEGVTQRGIARLLGCNRGTVCGKIRNLSKRVPSLQRKLLSLSRSDVKIFQYDELETYHKTKLKPVSISIAIEPKTRVLVGLFAEQMPCKGKLQKISNEIYGKFKDLRDNAREKTLQNMKLTAITGKVHTDGATVLRKFFKNQTTFDHIPHKRRYHLKHKMDDYKPEINLRKEKYPLYGEGNPLWFVDFICAKLRARIAVLARRTWTTSKGISEIQDCLNLFLAYHNKLPVFKRYLDVHDFIGQISPK